LEEIKPLCVRKGDGQDVLVTDFWFCALFIFFNNNTQATGLLLAHKRDFNDQNLIIPILSTPFCSISIFQINRFNVRY
jgi:hypothetical protein